MCIRECNPSKMTVKEKGSEAREEGHCFKIVDTAGEMDSKLPLSSHVPFIKG